MLVSPARNQSSSWTIDLRCSFLVVSSGKPLGEIEPHLMAEHRQRAGAGAVALLHAVGEDVFHQIEILAHRGPGPSRSSANMGKFTPPGNRAAAAYQRVG